MKKTLKIIIYFILGLIVLFGLFLTYSTIKDYKPAPEEIISKAKGEVINVYDTLQLLDWNIGYCGLGKEMSFFYDGGEKTRTTKAHTKQNLENISAFLKSQSHIDFYLLQEVDRNSRRSYSIDQLDKIARVLPDYHPYFAYNYKVKFIPVPPTNPLGHVEGGLATFSKYESYSVKRYSFVGNYDWPKGLMMLDRCFMVKRFYTSNGKELLLINTHNSAYDNGNLRKQQMAQLKTFLLNEYDKGNYIIVGGDWNQNPPLQGKKTSEYTDKHLTRIRIAYDFMPPEWNWMANEETPTNRMLYEPYVSGQTRTSVIDFFLISPNLIPIMQQNVNLNFENSDHQPVLAKIAFKH